MKNCSAFRCRNNHACVSVCNYLCICMFVRVHLRLYVRLDVHVHLNVWYTCAFLDRFSPVEVNLFSRDSVSIALTSQVFVSSLKFGTCAKLGLLNPSSEHLSLRSIIQSYPIVHEILKELRIRNFDESKCRCSFDASAYLLLTLLNQRSHVFEIVSSQFNFLHRLLTSAYA